MAKKSRPQSKTLSSQASVSKSLATDPSDLYFPEASWTYARNAINNSKKGDLGKLSTEQSNKLCTFVPYTIIGAIHIEEDRWVLFSTNNVDSEIGIFKEGSCLYTKLVNAKCLNFNTDNLIKGIIRPSYDCSHIVYWDDGRNVTRYLNINDVPWIQNCKTDNGCITCVDTDQLDCDKIRLEPFIKTPCITLKKGTGAGSLLNGTYQVQIAYLDAGIKVTDYFIPSNPLSLFSHLNINSSIDVEISNLDLNFDEYELILISTIAEKTVARKMGNYSTSQTKVTFDYIDLAATTSTPLKLLPIITPVPDKSEAMFSVGKYALRVAPTTKFDFNYQPLANQIETYWQSIEYPFEYYKKGGTNIGYMRDEVYPFFIRWVYNTGDKSFSYHIPGRAPATFFLTNDAGNNAGAISEIAPCPITVNDLESPGYTPKVFEVYNTATLTATPNTVLPDGGVVIAEGKMGYWESVELYDDKKPIVWNANIPGKPEYDLCGKPIRHHKFPENTIISGGSVNTLTNHYKDGGEKIRIMGIRFDNIKPPVDNNNVPIPNIVGYEILRGSRDGSKSVLYKGIINNMFEYDPPSLLTNRKALYANYPFNDLRPDPFISKNPLPTSYETLGGLKNYTPNDQYSKKHFTFHSPDCMFATPFLVDDELKIYGTSWGESEGYFTEPSQHPKHRFITDFTFMVGLVVGIGYAIGKLNGTRDVKYVNYQIDSDPPFLGSSNSAGNAVPAGAALTAAQAAALNTIGLQGFTDSLTGQNVGNTSSTFSAQGGAITASKLAASIPGTGVTSGYIEITFKDQNATPGLFKTILAALGNPIFMSYMNEGADITYKLIESLGKYRQFALQYQSICQYENFAGPQANNRRRRINNARYLNAGVQNYDSNYIINHVLRNETVVIDTIANVEDITGTLQDVSRPPRISTLPDGQNFNTFSRRASSHYVAIKNRLRNQYGQLNAIRQVLASTCVTPIGLVSSPVFFGGDTYIGKYSEKNTLYYFQNWLNTEPDGAVFNYNKQKMFEWTAFWMDTEPFDLAEFTQTVFNISNIASAFTGGGLAGYLNSIVTPSDKHCFDRLNPSSLGDNGIFLLKNAYMYLFNSGIRNFFVESEFNIDMRDWEDMESKQHYPVIQDLKTIFNMNLIKADNFYKIDRSLNWSFMASQKIPWGILQAKDYNPLLSETCFTKFPRRLMYSLPLGTELENDISTYKKDQWRIFLPNNYRDYTSNVVAIKSINKTGALILFDSQAPGLLPGVSEFKTTDETVTIGDGNLFKRELQQLSNSDKSYEYSSCQSRLSVLNCPAGVFWINLNQGKIFTYTGQLKELSLKNNQYWLNTYLPYKLLKDFPNYEVTDNPVAGIGCQTIYDNEYGLVYFCKKDYRLKPNLPVTVEYIGGSKFLINGVFVAKTGDPLYFDDCSWTLSYDPKVEEFVSFHDWHPNLSLGAKNTFLTTKDNSIWKHNDSCNSYCNYYGVNYPFEIEFPLDSKLNVTTMRNVEYYIESYIYDQNNCYDKFHVLDHGFDEAVIYNSEQVSGLLRLHLTPKNNLKELLEFPKIQTNYIDILFSKEEHKYRFNQFWDITKDRGEFTNVAENIWTTEDNGYVRNLNPNNLNYNKKEFERKKFRHYSNKVLLKRNINNNVEILVALATTVHHQSLR